MGWLNGHAQAGALTPALVVETAKQAQITDTPKNTTAELARFMPVMDITQAVARRDLIVQVVKQLMVEGTDYGKIQGCGDKPMLLLPGAQKLANLFGLTLRYHYEEKVEDWSGADHGGEPFFYYVVRAEVYRGEFVIAEGVGACHSWEAKYRWRKGERTCPQCSQPNIRKSKDSGWYCWKKTGGCGAVFSDGDPAIEKQEVGRKPNPDVFDQVNTIQKMAYKRCQVHGVINGTSCSEFFSQDLEDFTAPMDDIDTGGSRPGTSQAAQYVAQQKIAANDPQSRNVPWKRIVDMPDMFKAMRQAVGETAYLGELERYGWRRFEDIKNALNSLDKSARSMAMQKAVECYWHLDAIARKEVA